MPKYKSEQFISWIKKGYFDFMKYDDYKDKWNTLTSDLDKNILTVLFFTGSRPVELPQIERRHILKEKRYIKLGIPTAKRREDEKLRFLKIPLKHPEVKEFWNNTLKDMPDSFFVFADLRNYLRIADALYYKLKIRPYFFRHNFLSLLAMAGATIKQLQYAKGSATEQSVYSYLHLSARQQTEISRLFDKAIK